jgi:preprotein translocase SecE subunit
MKFEIYKPGQGKYARLIVGFLLAALIAYGCSSLRGYLRDVTYGFSLGSQTFSLGQLIPAGIWLVCVVVIFVGLNYPKFADFLIETEIEMGRVIWPTRRSVISSSIVVILTTVLMSAILWGVDSLLYSLLKLVKIY